MLIYDVIQKKRNGLKLSDEEINFSVSGYTGGSIPDYQMSALLMAVFINGLDRKETLSLTRAMTDSGDKLDLSGIEGIKVDKHSTGGVGDGTSLVLAPLLASCGVIVPMMSGRGLGHTGGTLDKLESIPGFNVNLSVEEFKRVLSKTGAAMIGQTENIAPADKKLYALRDVTATVDCVPLIASSIMSKKLAEGCGALLLDVKTGSGSFMKTDREAETLARAMIDIARGAGLKVSALITDMNQPLGKAVGNSLEVIQAVETLCNGGPEDFRKLVLELGSRMLVLSGKCGTPKDASCMLEGNLGNGHALEKFKQIIEAQGGDPSFIDHAEKKLPVSKDRRDVAAPTSGYVQNIDTEAVGTASILLGAGRISKEDKVDHGAGIIIEKKTGDKVEKGMPLAVFFCGAGARFEEAKHRFLGAYTIGPGKPEKNKLVHKEIH